MVHSESPKTPHTSSNQVGRKRFPWSHVVGYLLSIAFTWFAFELVSHRAMHFGPLLFAILALGVLQILVQLLFFMHVLEKHGPRYHILAFATAMFFVFVFVGSSLWIMSFNTPM
ncbi:cytochrome C oxidase subunit IV family protein [Alicyclobacillus tolerans]|uniref:cytochrome o ubiquinol oxidase subunit IV n=1 Tax=Alicyclobacillus tolerans TaxID=90970 RepID=UPI001F01EFDB|nr:cytochrome C oxidase subunit IV family protein [Alicyclobacillus tolerans]MCF8565428.1 cytochrome C oxidase subunit IV family protein [Alicyclobacillus tolerans]